MIISCWRSIRRCCGHKDVLNDSNDYIDDGLYYSAIHGGGFGSVSIGQGGRFRCNSTTNKPTAYGIGLSRYGRTDGNYITASTRYPHSKPASDVTVMQGNTRPASLPMRRCTVSLMAANNHCPHQSLWNGPDHCSDVTLDRRRSANDGDWTERGVILTSAAMSSNCSRLTSSTDGTPQLHPFESFDRSMRGEGNQQEHRGGIISSIDVVGGSPMDRPTIVVPTVSIVDDWGNVSESVC